MSADIERIFQQVLISPGQRSLHRILSRADVNKPIEVCELNTVTYGTSAAYFLAIRCLIQLAHNCEERLPEIAKIIRKYFYVDDLLTGASTIEHKSLIAKQISEVLLTGCYKIRKWVSNDPRAIAEVIESEHSPNLIHLVLTSTWN